MPGVKLVDTRSLRIVSRDGESKVYDQVLDEAETLGFLNQLEGVRQLPGKGRFLVTFISDEGKLENGKNWRDHAAQGRGLFEPEEETFEEMQEFKLEFLHFEFREEDIKEVLEEYVRDPQVQHVMLRGSIKSPFMTVRHKGFVKTPSQKLFYAPGRFAIIRGATHIPASEYRLKCLNCLETGHLKFKCPKDKVCFKCKKTGHIGRDCPKCPNCNKPGHKGEECRTKSWAAQVQASQEAKEQTRKKPEKIAKPQHPETKEKEKVHPPPQTDMPTGEKRDRSETEESGDEAMEESDLIIDMESRSESTEEEGGDTFKTVQQGRKGKKKKKAQVSTKLNQNK